MSDNKKQNQPAATSKPAGETKGPSKAASLSNQTHAPAASAPAGAAPASEKPEIKMEQIPVFILVDKYLKDEKADEEIGKLRGQQKAVLSALKKIGGEGTAEEVEKAVDSSDFTKQNRVSVVAYHLKRAQNEGLVKEGKPREVPVETKPRAKKETAPAATTEAPAAATTTK